MAEGAQGGDFKLVLDAVDDARREEAVAELAEVFFLDAHTAAEAVRNAPIVLIAGMTQEQAANLRTHVLRLARLGARLRLTAEPVGRLKQLRWQALPPVVRRPANIFVCPNCGERFVVQRWTAPAAPQPAAAPRQAAPEAPAAEAAAEAEAQEAAPVAEAVPLAEAAAEVPEAEPVVEAEPVAAGEAEGEFAELQAAAAESEQTEEEPRVAEEEKEPAPAGPSPSAAPPSAPSGPRYDVSVAKVRGEKAERLVDLLVEREGISYEEARSRCERTVVVVCRNAPSSEADGWRRALLKIGIKPRIRKRSN